MVRQRNAAIRALHARATASAQHKPRIAAAVDENQRLRAVFQALRERLMQSRRNWTALQCPPKFVAQVYDFDARQRTICDTRRQGNQAIFARLRVAITFERWGSRAQ